MERIKETLQQGIKKREVFVYGAGEAGKTMLRLMKVLNIDVSFFADRKWMFFHDFCGFPVYGVDKLNPAKHYPVLNNSSDLRTVESMKSDLICQGYEPGDWFNWGDNVDFDISINGITVGKGTPVIDCFLNSNAEKLFLSVGRYTSINPTLYVSFNHYIGLSTSFRVPNDDIRRQKFTVANRIEIGNDVYIGANVFINQSKVKKIGNGAIIGTGAVVLEDVPPYAVVAGVPAKVKKFRFSPEQILTLEKIQWWNWDNETMVANADCFVTPELFFERFS
jgi:aminocyclitol acetyltransferase